MTHHTAEVSVRAILCAVGVIIGVAVGFVVHAAEPSPLVARPPSPVAITSACDDALITADAMIHDQDDMIGKLLASSIAANNGNYEKASNILDDVSNLLDGLPTVPSFEEQYALCQAATP